MQQLDHAALVAAARRVGALIVLRFRPGQFMLRGEALAAVVPARAGAALEQAIDRHIVIGHHRTLTQDNEFGIAQIVEIAIRALSPAVNDTFTGVACVDWLADALLALAEQSPLEGNWFEQHWRAPRVDPFGQDRTPREARVRSDPPGIRNDTCGLDPAARRDSTSGSPDACRCSSLARRSGRSDPGHIDWPRRARPTRPRHGVRSRTAKLERRRRRVAVVGSILMLS